VIASRYLIFSLKLKIRHLCSACGWVLSVITMLQSLLVCNIIAGKRLHSGKSLRSDMHELTPYSISSWTKVTPVNTRGWRGSEIGTFAIKLWVYVYLILTPVAFSIYIYKVHLLPFKVSSISILNPKSTAKTQYSNGSKNRRSLVLGGKPYSCFSRDDIMLT